MSGTYKELSSEPGAALFATTHWSVVLAAGESESPEAAAALEKLCRTFVLHACEYFLAKQWRDATRLKRGGVQKVISLDAAAAEYWYHNEPADPMTPERSYERQWALALLDLAMERLRQEWAVAGKETLFATLQLFLSGERKAITCAQAALELGMSEGAVRTAVHRLRQHYGEILRAEVGQTLSRQEDLEDELRHLLTVL